MTEAVVNISGAAGQVACSAGKEAILKTLAYFDIFQYPLTFAEINQFSTASIDETELREELTQLEMRGLVFCISGYYLLQNNPSLCQRRKSGNEKAAQLLVKAQKIGRFLYQFPFVRGVGISGSLSKNFADDKADIDFFIITRSNRLWIARTLMHIFKKLTFLSGRQHYYCMNYYIDEMALKLDDKNIFAATEIKTLLPVSGQVTLQEFFNHNSWADIYLPGCTYRQQAERDPKRSFLKRTGEWLLANKAGNLLEKFFMRLTQKRWNKKEDKGKRNEKGLPMGLISGKHFARSNPGGLQEKVLLSYRQRVEELTRRLSIVSGVLLPL